MSYQKCPNCNGTGKEYPQYWNGTTISCSVCNGYKIISELTGLPPSQNTRTDNMKKKTNITTYKTTKDIIIPKGTIIDDNGDSQFQFVLGYGKNFAQIIDVVDMEGMFAEKLLEEITVTILDDNKKNQKKI